MVISCSLEKCISSNAKHAVKWYRGRSDLGISGPVFGLFRFNIIRFMYLNGIRKLDDNHVHTNLFKTELIDGDYWEKLENVKASNTARNPHYPTIYTVKQRHCNIVSKVKVLITTSQVQIAWSLKAGSTLVRTVGVRPARNFSKFSMFGLFLQNELIGIRTGLSK